MTIKHLIQVVPAEGVTAGPVSSAVAQHPERELIVLAPRGGQPEYFGSRAQLEAEGLIPENTVWPKGTIWRYWTSGVFRFSLFRTRQHGTNGKGPAKVWMEGDWWCLRCGLINAEDCFAQRIQEMQAEIADLTHRRSPEGERQFYELYARYEKCSNDMAFQTFKSTFLPEPKKSGRRAVKVQS